MSTPVTLEAVQMLMDAHETRTAIRHSELLARMDKLEDRMRLSELESAENRPLIRGWKGASAIIFSALVAGYIGSIFAN